MLRLGAVMAFVAMAAGCAPSHGAQARPPSASARRINILLITADDMNWDSPGCFGNPLPGITPQIDALAEEGMRFVHAHVTAAVCTPCRSVLLTGLYPHRNGAEGFQRIKPEVPTLPEVLRASGYRCGSIGKSLGQREKFRWADEYDEAGKSDEAVYGRRPDTYYRFTLEFLRKAHSEGSPFFLMANSHDPHRPFHGGEDHERRFGSPGREVARPSHVYRPDEIHVPPFLPDLPEVRRELAQYYSSVSRCDDTVGEILRALRESGLETETLVMFLSDNGMSFPFAKTNCYLNSTRTPWIVRWPGHVRAGSLDDTHMISTLDFMPTVLDVAGIAPVNPTDGRSFLPLLYGRPQSDRDYVFTQFHHIHGKRPYPMRCVQTRRFGYIFNPWADGKRVYDAEPLSDLSFPAMQRAAEDHPAIRERVRFLLYRQMEEFYDFEKDPHALNNLIYAPAYAAEVDRLRRELLDWMVRTEDPATEAMRSRHSSQALDAFMRDYANKAAREIEELKEYERATGYRF